jgi:hypothetical protein
MVRLLAPDWLVYFLSFSLVVTTEALHTVVFYGCILSIRHLTVAAYR